MSNLIVIVLVLAIALSVIFLLIWKNKKDEKLLNPDDRNAVDEVMMNHERKRNKI